MKKFRLVILSLVAACFSIGVYANVCSDSDAPSDCQVTTTAVKFDYVISPSFNCPSYLPYAWGADLYSDKTVKVTSTDWSDDEKNGIQIVMWYIGSGKATVTADLACSGTQKKGSGIYVKVS